MKKEIQRFLVLLLTLLSLWGAALGEDEVVAEVIELPEATKGKFVELTVDNDPMVGPKKGYYKFRGSSQTPYAYVNPSITVNIGSGRIYKTDYMYARVKIASPMQIRTMMAGSWGEATTVTGPNLAKRVKAVIAINGVLEADGDVVGPVVRQGVWLRPNPVKPKSSIESWKAKEGRDTLVIDSNGDLRILEASTWGETVEQIEAMGEDAVNVITFGPALVIDGEPQYGYQNRQMSTGRVAQRMAICQTGPLEYLLITSAGPENSGNTGLKLDQFVELIASFPDVKTAYNLDGGSSSTMVFRKGDSLWAKINVKGVKVRPIQDLIYFADAWKPSSGGK